MPRKASVPIYDGDDMEQIALLRRAVTQAEERAARAVRGAGPRRAGDEIESADESEVDAAKAAYDAFVLEAAERADIWEVSSIGHAEFRALLKEHPPRTEVVRDEDTGIEREQVIGQDATFGVNTDTFPLALLSFVDPDDDEIRTVVAPALEPDALRRRLKRLAAGEFDTLWVRAMACNTSGVGDPKASLFSTTSPSTTAT